MEKEELYRKFRQTGQEAVRLQTALEGYFSEECDDREREEYGAYLRRRIRPAAELLIRQGDTEKISCLENAGWFGAAQLDGFIRFAGEQKQYGVLMWLMRLKREKFGFPDRDFSL